MQVAIRNTAGEEVHVVEIKGEAQRRALLGWLHGEPAGGRGTGPAEDGSALHALRQGLEEVGRERSLEEVLDRIEQGAAAHVEAAEVEAEREVVQLALRAGARRRGWAAVLALAAEGARQAPEELDLEAALEALGVAPSMQARLREAACGSPAEEALRGAMLARLRAGMARGAEARSGEREAAERRAEAADREAGERRIVIEVRGGLVQPVSIPGIVVEIRDYDMADEGDLAQWHDGEGRAYAMCAYHGGPEEAPQPPAGRGWSAPPTVEEVLQARARHSAAWRGIWEASDVLVLAASDPRRAQRAAAAVRRVLEAEGHEAPEAITWGRARRDPEGELPSRTGTVKLDGIESEEGEALTFAVNEEIATELGVDGLLAVHVMPSGI